MPNLIYQVHWTAQRSLCGQLARCWRQRCGVRAAVVGNSTLLQAVCSTTSCQIEEYEKHLIRVTKAGHVNLMATAKRATNRDFK